VLVEVRTFCLAFFDERLNSLQARMVVSQSGFILLGNVSVAWSTHVAH